MSAFSSVFLSPFHKLHYTMDDASVEKYRKEGYAMVDWICNYYKKVESYPVLSHVKPNEIREKLPIDAPEKGEDFAAIVKDIDNIILPGVTHWQHPNFFAYYPSNTSFPSLLGDMVASGLGVQGMMWITSPACTELETHVLDWMGKLLKLPDVFMSPFCGGKLGGGMIQGTASEVVLSVLVAARWRIVHKRIPHISNLDTTNLGNTAGDPEKEKINAELDSIYVKLVAYVSDQTHSAVRKGCLVGGIRHLRIIPSNEQLSMSPEKLVEQLKEDIAKGLIPVFVCATVGTTSTAAVDSLPLIGEICKRHNVWLHVDGAYAGAFCILPELRQCIDGVELADSFNFNPHKSLLTNFDCSTLWVQDRKSLIDSLTLTPEFLRNKATEQGGVFDYKDWSVPLGRRFRSLKLWFVMRMYGVEGLHAYLRRLLEFGKLLESLITADNRFEMMAQRKFALVCFRLKASNDENKKLLDTLTSEKNVYLSHTIVHNKYTMRMALAATTATNEHIKKAWTTIQETASTLFPDLSPQ